MGVLSIFVITLLGNVAFLSAAPPADLGEPSPCPDRFKYGSRSTPGSYQATVTVDIPHELHGLWVRLIFDKPVKELTTSGEGFQAVRKEQKPSDYLVKNPDILLKAGTSISFKITVKYDGKDIPNLQEFRVNAVTYCPTGKDPSIKYFLGDKQSEDYLESITTPPKKLTEPNFKCGIVSDTSNISPPWENALFVHINNTDVNVCDATLVSDKWFLTAAHCVTYLDSKLPIAKDKIKIYFDSYEAQPVSSVIIYPGYNPVNLLNDIALFQLEKPLELSDTIRPVCLPSKSEGESGNDGIIPGYINVKRVSVKAKEISRDKCIKQLPDLKSIIADDVTCADYSEALPSKNCVGQSGSSFSALKAGSNDIYELKGIIIAGAVLQGKKECTKGTTVVLADTTKYNVWIKATIF